mgnify:CR=1 FL=1
MRNLIKKFLNVKTVKIKSIKIDKLKNIVTVSLEPTKGQKYLCPICGKKAKYYDKGKGIRHWRALDLGSMQVLIEGEAPRVNCKKHGVHTAKVPWARHQSTFTLDFENTVTWLSLHCSRKTVAEFMRISWNTVGPIISRCKKDADSHPEHRFNNLKRIGIDETSFKKGHKYLTVIVDHDKNSVIWVHEKHGKEVLKQFLEELTPEQRAGIECYSADGARWISETMTEYCPNAQRCLDSYHLVEWVNAALDEVRTEAWHKAKEEEEANTKKKPGRPKKGEEKDKTAQAIKGSATALGKAPEHLTETQKAKIDFIARTDRKLYRAYCLKEMIRTLIKLPANEIDKALKSWLWKASHSRIPAIYELQKKIRRHINAILNTAKYKLSNARIEAMNNKIKLTIRMAYGFRNIENLKDMIMLRCSHIPIFLPGRTCFGHTY